MANEKRLTYTDELLNNMCDRCNIENEGCPCEPEDCFIYNVIANTPTVDAVEVVHGYWIDSTNVDHMGRIIEHGIDCSVCDSVFKDDSREVMKRWKERFKICPFCGAKMDGGNEDGC